MELLLHTPTLRWQLAAPLATANGDVSNDTCGIEPAGCSVVLEYADAKERLALPCTLTLPCPTDASALDAFLAQRVTFSVLDADKTVLSTHALPLRDCVPMLTESTIAWHESVTWQQTSLELSVEIPVVASKEPRQLIENIIRYKRRARYVAEKLSLHRNAVAIALLPPLLGCALGAVIVSPVLIPVTLLIAILGFPLWTIVGVALSLLVVVSTITTVVAVRLARSKRLQREVVTFLRGPHGQLLLFRNASPDEPRIKDLVMHNKRYKLLASVLIDCIGNATFVVPVFGELADVLWAPFSASIVAAMYSQSTPNIGKIAFIEEFLPFSDFIPTASLAWIKENVRFKDLPKLFGMLRSVAAEDVPKLYGVLRSVAAEARK